jgi:hypothetical protein
MSAILTSEVKREERLIPFMTGTSPAEDPDKTCVAIIEIKTVRYTAHVSIQERDC